MDSCHILISIPLNDVSSRSHCGMNKTILNFNILVCTVVGKNEMKSVITQGSLNPNFR